MSFDDRPVTELKRAAIALNEMFLTMVDSGFSEEQALRLVAHLIRDITQQD
jgi:hypothetical protein